MIPDEAVDAAGRVFIDIDPLWPDGAWEDMAEEQRENARGIVAAVLEAATPRLLREAWEAGCLEGLSYNPGYDEEALAQNPYKEDPK